MIVRDIKKGDGWTAGMPEPPNGLWTLPQRVGYPCQFRYKDASYWINWEVSVAGLSRVNIHHPIGIPPMFLGGRDTICRTYFTNDYENGPTIPFYGGVTFAFPSFLPTKIAIEYAFAPLPKTSYHLFELTEEELVIRYRQRPTSSRLFVKYNDG